jgi:hypothetical protein
MSDARWIDVDTDIASAVGHFGRAVEIYHQADFKASGLEGYKSTASFQFAIQSGYTAAEAAIRRISDILQEDQPTGQDSHKDLIVRFSRPRADAYARPALFTDAIARDMLEVMRARHRARHSYDDFDVQMARPTAAAVERLIANLPVAVREFRNQIDPQFGHE